MTRHSKKVCLLIFGGLILFLFSHQTTRSFFGSTVLEIVGPPMELFAKLKETTRSFWEDYIHSFEIKEQRDVLERKVAELEAKIRILESLTKEVVKEGVSFSLANNYPTLWAKIVGYEMVPNPTVAIIDKGHRHGIQRNMPVIYEDKVVGKIIQTSHNYSKLMFITDPNMTMGALLKETEEKGIINGSTSGYCQLKFIPIISEVNIGGEVLTSGTDGIFPPNLKIGTVKKVEKPNISKWCYIEVEPSVIFNKLTIVLVVLKEDELLKIQKEFQK